MRPYLVMWSPTGQPLVKVIASTPTNALKACPRPYSKYKGEIRAMPLSQYEMEIGKFGRPIQTVTLY